LQKVCVCSTLLRPRLRCSPSSPSLSPQLPSFRPICAFDTISPALYASCTLAQPAQRPRRRSSQSSTGRLRGSCSSSSGDGLLSCILYVFLITLSTTLADPPRSAGLFRASSSCSTLTRPRVDINNPRQPIPTIPEPLYNATTLPSSIAL
jgi:hypothetical protein